MSTHDDTTDTEMDGTENDAVETVEERILDELDATAVHGMTVTARRGETFYVVVAHTRDSQAGPAVDLRTVVVDLDAETVKVGDNGLWIPADANALDGLTRSVARSTTDTATGVSDEPPVVNSIPSVDPESVLGAEVPRDDYEHDDNDGHDGVPEEIDRVIDRLEEAGIGASERFQRLKFGGKAVWGEHHLVDKSGLHGNYGVYATREDALVLVDVDDPDALDVDLPETFRVSSPHGSDERAHHYYAVDDLDAIEQALGTFNHGPTWGDVRTVNQYVVGPGSQLDGCDKDGCTDCDASDGGVYELTNDAPIHEFAADDLVDLLAADPEVERVDDTDESEQAADEADADETADPDEDVADDEPAHAGEPDHVECYRCDEQVPEADATVFASDEETTYYVCKGGCGE